MRATAISRAMLVAVVLAALFTAYEIEPTAAAAASCASLRSLALPNTTITAAELVPAAPYPAKPSSPGTVPAYCRVTAMLTPSSDSHIEMELWLPTVNWNGKFKAFGSGGWAGFLPTVMMPPALMEGYATVTNDGGHKGNFLDASFALGHPEKLVDYGSRSVHETAITSKAIIGTFYGRPPRFSYWYGCSTGGGQGLREAQRYPEDFDGIVAGAPANYMTHLMAGVVWIAQAIHIGQPGSIPKEKLPLLHEAVIRTCDALDGVKDGVLEDPTRCKFDPAILECKGADGPACLTASQVEAARKVYGGAVNPRTHQQIYPGELPGSELGWQDSPAGVGIAESYFRVLFKDPDWDYRKLDFDGDVALAEKTHGSVIDGIDPNLAPFFAHGGKLIQYHGWNDQVISPLNSVNYYKTVQQKLGRQAKIDDSYRLFMVPGMNHCGGGDGPSSFFADHALERWRESNIAPSQIPAMLVTGGDVWRVRPLCPYPQVAVYKGSGSTWDAANFSCKVP